MDLEYTQDKPHIIKALWRIMEDLEEEYPNLRIGWWGFIPMFFEWGG